MIVPYVCMQVLPQWNNIEQLTMFNFGIQMYFVYQI